MNLRHVGRSATKTPERRHAQFRALALAVALLLALPPAALMSAETEIVVGHIDSYSGRRQAEQMFAEIAAGLPEVAITYDHSLRGKPADPLELNRLLYEERLADVLVVYAGPAKVLNEISGLARAGRIMPLDQIPGAQERLRFDDFYPNVLEPVTFDGHLWALPTRMVVPVLIDHTEELDSSTWETFIQSVEETSFGSAAERYNLPGKLVEDFYLLWRTLLRQSGLQLGQHGLYDLDDPRCWEAFQAIHRLYLRRAERPEILIGSSDVLTDFPDLLNSLVHDFPPRAECRCLHRAMDLVCRGARGPERATTGSHLAVP